MKKKIFHTSLTPAITAMLTAILALTACKKEGVSNPGLGSSAFTDMLVYRNNYFVNNQSNIAGIFSDPRYSLAGFSYSFVDTASTTHAYNYTKARDTSFLYFQIIRSNTQVGSVTVTLQDTTNTTIAYQQKIDLSDTTSYTLLDGWDTARISPLRFVRGNIYLARINRAGSGEGDPYSPGAVNDFYHWPIVLSNTYMIIGKPYNLIVSWIDGNNRQTADTVYRAIQIAN